MEISSSQDILNLRLHNQHLLGEKFDNPAQVVEHLGAVQSQDFPAAKWALGLRVKNSTDEKIEQAFNEGKFLRTHIMRPTWHFVSPKNIRWMQELTSHRVLKMNSRLDKQLELDGKIINRCHDVLTNALQGHNYLTRQQLAEELEKHKIPARGQRLAYIIMHAELSSLICSGPRLGKQFSYALVDERAPKAKSIDREEALAKLTLTYFKSHGPAQLKDFAWWSGLTLTEAKEGLELVKSKLASEVVNEKTYWFTSDTKTKPRNSTNAFLLSIYDEYTIAYKDRTDLSEERYIEQMIKMGNALTAVIIVDGKVAGTWKRKIKKSKVEFKKDLFHSLNEDQNKALQRAIETYKKFVLAH